MPAYPQAPPLAQAQRAAPLNAQQIMQRNRIAQALMAIQRPPPQSNMPMQRPQPGMMSAAGPARGDDAAGFADRAGGADDGHRAGTGRHWWAAGARVSPAPWAAVLARPA